ncbi:hypothetical protein M438DRAFT_163499 [Aureobasidium pullulans EXF-150]|uniref:Uncharacterized protein n=1 Tax=Aureobasidium pullulans EXF-150 TaxID=1043002 RepID=A0A074YJX5_AURPU|nr:uncharacterized protein M438DRAFT_163499 [Aureobasidium pullulans EXF-150]KEQ87176.1 hypothetical protein M438DRAFT_163499 [Aureobasidium pullulans EXF-150]
MRCSDYWVRTPNKSAIETCIYSIHRRSRRSGERYSGRSRTASCLTQLPEVLTRRHHNRDHKDGMLFAFLSCFWISSAHRPFLQEGGTYVYIVQ